MDQDSRNNAINCIVVVALKDHDIDESAEEVACNNNNNNNNNNNKNNNNNNNDNNQISSKHSGSWTDDVHKTTWLFYNYLLFLNDKLISGSAKTKISNKTAGSYSDD